MCARACGCEPHGLEMQQFCDNWLHQKVSKLDETTISPYSHRDTEHNCYIRVILLYHNRSHIFKFLVYRQAHKSLFCPSNTRGNTSTSLFFKKKSNIFSPKSATKNLNETASNITLLPMFQGSHCYKYARGRGEGRKEISNSETKGNVRR